MKQRKFNVTVEYEQEFLPTTRHKKPRHAARSEEIKLSIKRPETAAEFPVAMVVSDYATKNGEFMKCKNTLRLLNGELYSRERYPGRGCVEYVTEKNVISGIEGFGASCIRCSNAEEMTEKSVLLGSDKDERIAEAKERASEYVLYNREYWKQCSEPMYVVMTFGLGHNHGGTSLCLDYGYNPNIPADRYFTALERGKAVKAALSIAESRGDTYYLDHIKNAVEDIKVLLPEAVKNNPAADHGDGDPFMTAAEELIKSSDGTMDAGLSVIALAMTQQ